MMIGLGHVEGVFDKRIDEVAQDYTKKLEIILGENNSIDFINKYTIMFFVVFVNFFILLAMIPTVVKFGNWYAKTLKQAHYQSDD